MEALVTALGCYLGAALYLRFNRDRGGWFELNRIRRGLPTRTPQPRWEELYPSERGFFFAAPFFGFLGVVLTIVGILVLAVGDN